MSLVVNTNIGSLNAQRSLASSSNELATAMERLSSGKKINSAADDAAGFAIAERMTAQVRGLNMATKNANDGLSMLAVIENATNDVTDMLQRMRELAVQAVNDTNSQTDREYLQQEASSLIEEIHRVATQTKYNGSNVLDGSKYGSFQIGTDAGQTINFEIKSIAMWAIGDVSTYNRENVASATSVATQAGQSVITLDQEVSFAAGDKLAIAGNGDYEVISSSGNSVTVRDDFEDVGTTFNNAQDNGWSVGVDAVTGRYQPVEHVDLVHNASEALHTISEAIEQVAGQRAEYGALQNRLEYTVSNLMNVSEFTTAARSRIEDADFAAESARLAKAQVLQQTGTAMLAQANASSQLAISLIR